MKEIFIVDATLPGAYHQALTALKTSGTEINCSDWNTRQIECAMTVHITSPLQEPAISKLIPGGFYDLQRYIMEMCDGILDFKIGHGWDYTYHERFSKYLPFVINELKRNPESRRAVISIRDNEIDSKNKDAACMQSLQFFIRSGCLDMMVLFRSNDLLKAFFFNAFALIKLQEKIAGELGVSAGSYTHRSNSMHCYGRDFELLDNYTASIARNPLPELTYNYKGEWEELMSDEIPNIMKLVENLKKN